MLRDRVIEALRAADHVVLAWGSFADRPFLIVRPGGVVGGYESIQVWVVGFPQTAGGDPDAGLAELGLEVYGLMQAHLQNIILSPGSDYAPGGVIPRSTLVLTGDGPDLISTLGR